MGELEGARQSLEAERRSLAEARDIARTAARESGEAAHALALTLESQRAQVLALSQALERMGGQRGQLDARLGELASQLSDGDAPVTALERERQAALEERLRSEQALGQARTALEGIDHGLRELEQTRHQRDEQAIAQREAIGQRRLDQQALVIKAEQLARRWPRPASHSNEVVAETARRSRTAAWEKAVTDLDAKLRRLEPVNLAAISEHAEAAERMQYLDAQNTDLSSALETLEDAIRKIDRETRGRFKDTFDRVNCRRAGDLPAAVRRRPRLPGTDRRGPARHRRDDHGAAPGQARVEHLAAVGRREGDDRGGAGVLDLPAQPGAVLPARRGRRAAGRGQRRPLHRAGHRDERAGAVPVRDPQQGDDGGGAPAVGRDHARARRQPAGVGRPGRGRAPRRPERSEGRF
jgi:hypothetical protein